MSELKDFVKQNYDHEDIIRISNKPYLLWKLNNDQLSRTGHLARLILSSIGVSNIDLILKQHSQSSPFDPITRFINNLPSVSDDPEISAYLSSDDSEKTLENQAILWCSRELKLTLFFCSRDYLKSLESYQSNSVYLLEEDDNYQAFIPLPELNPKFFASAGGVKIYCLSEYETYDRFVCANEANGVRYYDNVVIHSLDDSCVTFSSRGEEQERTELLSSLLYTGLDFGLGTFFYIPMQWLVLQVSESRRNQRILEIAAKRQEVVAAVTSAAQREINENGLPTELNHLENMIQQLQAQLDDYQQKYQEIQERNQEFVNDVEVRRDAHLQSAEFEYAQAMEQVNKKLKVQTFNQVDQVNPEPEAEAVVYDPTPVQSPSIYATSPAISVHTLSLCQDLPGEFSLSQNQVDTNRDNNVEGIGDDLISNARDNTMIVRSMHSTSNEQLQGLFGDEEEHPEFSNMFTLPENNNNNAKSKPHEPIDADFLNNNNTVNEPQSVVRKKRSIAVNEPKRSKKSKVDTPVPDVEAVAAAAAAVISNPEGEYYVKFGLDIPKESEEEMKWKSASNQFLVLLDKCTRQDQITDIVDNFNLPDLSMSDKRNRLIECIQAGAFAHNAVVFKWDNKKKEQLFNLLRKSDNEYLIQTYFQINTQSHSRSKKEGVRNLQVMIEMEHNIELEKRKP